MSEHPDGDRPFSPGVRDYSSRSRSTDAADPAHRGFLRPARFAGRPCPRPLGGPRASTGRGRGGPRPTGPRQAAHSPVRRLHVALLSRRFRSLDWRYLCRPASNRRDHESASGHGGTIDWCDVRRDHGRSSDRGCRRRPARHQARRCNPPLRDDHLGDSHLLARHLVPDRVCHLAGMVSATRAMARNRLPADRHGNVYCRLLA